jgi:hypothetical protein
VDVTRIVAERPCLPGARKRIRAALVWSSGVYYIEDVVLTPDGAAYAYDYQQFQSDLYVVEGLRRPDRATAGSVAAAREDGMARPSKVHDGEDVSVFGGTGAMKTRLAVGAIVTSLAAVPGGSAAADDARLPAGRKWVRITAPAIAKQPVIGDLVASKAARRRHWRS